MTKEFINQIILHSLFKEDKVNVSKIRRKRYSNIRYYLFSYFDDNPTRWIEILFRIKYNVNRNYCIVCGKPTYFKGISWYKKTGKLYANFCSCKCSINSDSTKEAYKKSCIKKYRVNNPMKCKDIINKGKETCKSKYGYIRASILKEYKDKAKKTNIEKYGVEYPLQNKDINLKYHNTCYIKYGSYSPLANKEIHGKTQETTYNRYGVKCIFLLEENKGKPHSKEANTKRYNTMKHNNSFNSSRLEEELYVYIKTKFPNVIRQYKDERYPFNCDFYVPELDLFIELNGSWTHGKHAFNSDSEEDKLILEQWKEKAKTSKFYKNAIETWTVRDVSKRNKAKENKLNYKEVWSLNEAKEFIDYINYK